MAKLHGCALTNTDGCKQQNLLIMFCKHFGGKTKTIFYHFPEEWIMLSLLLANPPVKRLINDRQIKQFYRGVLQCSPPLLAIQHRCHPLLRGCWGRNRHQKAWNLQDRNNNLRQNSTRFPLPVCCFWDVLWIGPFHPTISAPRLAQGRRRDFSALVLLLLWVSEIKPSPTQDSNCVRDQCQSR